MITEDRKNEVLTTITPEVISEELIPDGTGRKRPLILKYTALDCVITETRFYMFPANDARHEAFTPDYQILLI